MPCRKSMQKLLYNLDLVCMQESGVLHRKNAMHCFRCTVVGVFKRIWCPGYNCLLDFVNDNWYCFKGISLRKTCFVTAVTVSVRSPWKIKMGSPDWNLSLADIHLWKLLWVYCPGHAGVRGNDKADIVVGKATLANGLLLGKSQALRSLKHYMQAQSQGHHPIDHLQERGVERESDWWSFLNGWERAIVNQIHEHLNRSKGKVGETSERPDGVHTGFSKHIDTILNWTELNRPLQNQAKVVFRVNTVKYTVIIIINNVTIASYITTLCHDLPPEYCNF